MCFQDDLGSAGPRRSKIRPGRYPDFRWDRSSAAGTRLTRRAELSLALAFLSGQCDMQPPSEAAGWLLIGRWPQPERLLSRPRRIRPPDGRRCEGSSARLNQTMKKKRRMPSNPARIMPPSRAVAPPGGPGRASCWHRCLVMLQPCRGHEPHHPPRRGPSGAEPTRESARPKTCLLYEESPITSQWCLPNPRGPLVAQRPPSRPFHAASSSRRVVDVECRCAAVAGRWPTSWQECWLTRLPSPPRPRQAWLSPSGCGIWALGVRSVPFSSEADEQTASNLVGSFALKQLPHGPQAPPADTDRRHHPVACPRSSPTTEHRGTSSAPISARRHHDASSDATPTSFSALHASLPKSGPMLTSRQKPRHDAY